MQYALSPMSPTATVTPLVMQRDPSNSIIHRWLDFNLGSDWIDLVSTARAISPRANEVREKTPISNYLRQSIVFIITYSTESDGGSV